jgi:HPr kinase/phosphorylase
MAMEVVHATSVALAEGAVVIVGASGSGKSALALRLMALGARLVADDQTILSGEGGRLVARCPAPLSGLIEARGVGLLRAVPVECAEVVLVIDLDHPEKQRLPPPRLRQIAGFSIPCLHKVDGDYFPAAIVQYVKGGKGDAA